MSNRRLFVQFGSVSIGRIVAALIQGLSLILLARNVTPSQFGVVASLLGVAWVAMAMFDLGLSTFVVRERSIRPESGLVTTALHVNNRLSLALCCMSFLLLMLLATTVNDDYLLLAPLAVWMSAERNADAWLGVAFADGDWRLNFGNLVLKRLSALLLFVLLHEFLFPALLAFSVAWAISSGLSSIWARMSVQRSLPDPEAIALRTLITETWPYWMHSMASQTNNLDVAVAGVSGGSFQAGIFATASRLTSPLRILPTSMAKAVLPAASRNTDQAGQRRLIKLCAMMFSLMLFVYAILFIATPVALPFALGSQYHPAIKPLQIVLLGLPFAAGSSLAGALLQGSGFKQYVANVSLSTSILYLAGVVIGMSWSGAIGAAIAMSAAYGFQFSMLLVRLIRTRGRPSIEGDSSALTNMTVMETRSQS